MSMYLEQLKSAIVDTLVKVMKITTGLYTTAPEREQIALRAYEARVDSENTLPIREGVSIHWQIADDPTPQRPIIAWVVTERVYDDGTATLVRDTLRRFGILREEIAQ